MGNKHQDHQHLHHYHSHHLQHSHSHHLHNSHSPHHPHIKINPFLFILILSKSAIIEHFNNKTLLWGHQYHYFLQVLSIIHLTHYLHDQSLCRGTSVPLVLTIFVDYIPYALFARPNSVSGDISTTSYFNTFPYALSAKRQLFIFRRAR